MEKNLEIFEAKQGHPLIVLVHKNDKNISFYDRIGILENLNDQEKQYLTNHIQKEIERQNK